MGHPLRDTGGVQGAAGVGNGDFGLGSIVFEGSDGCLSRDVQLGGGPVALELRREGQAGRALDGRDCLGPSRERPMVDPPGEIQTWGWVFASPHSCSTVLLLLSADHLLSVGSLQPGGVSRAKQRPAHPPCSQALLLGPAAGRELSLCLQSEIPGELEAVTLPESLTPVS